MENPENMREIAVRANIQTLLGAEHHGRPMVQYCAIKCWYTCNRIEGEKGSHTLLDGDYYWLLMIFGHRYGT